jgi:hypothetical protein
MAITGGRMSCVVRELNPAPCNAMHASSVLEACRHQTENYTENVRTAAMLLFYVLQKSCNEKYKPLPTTSSYALWDLKASVASIASTLKCACP